MTVLENYLKAHADELLEDVITLVEAESPSNDKRAVDACGTVLADIMRKRLGARMTVEPRAEYGDHLLFSVGEGSEKIAVLGHFDTVWDIGRLKLRLDGDKLYGPGVLDMKAGLVQSIWAVKALQDNNLLGDRQIRFICSSDEELASPSSREWIETQALQCSAVLVVEPAVAVTGNLKTERKGTGCFEISIQGKAAHAGNNPQDGINAVQEMALQVIELHKLNAPEQGTTINVGIASGGRRVNVVPEQATLSVDARVTNYEEAQRIDTAIRSIRPFLEGARIEVEGGITRPPLIRTPQSRQLFAKAQAAAEELGFALGEDSVGGGSDGNFTCAVGVPTLDGLGATGAGPHAEYEHVIVSDLTTRAALLAKLIDKI